MAYFIVSRVLVFAFDFTFFTKSLACLHRVNVNLCWDVLRLCVSLIISILSLFWFESQVDFWSLGECASALTSKPWFVQTFEYRIQCSHTADSAARCGQLVRIRPAKTKASGTRWKAAQTTPVFLLVGRYASCSANMVSRTWCVHVDVCFGSELGEFPKVTWWPPSFGFFSSVPHVSATYYRLHRPGILVRLWGRALSLRWSFKWESWRPALQNWLVVRILGSKLLPCLGAVGMESNKCCPWLHLKLWPGMRMLRMLRKPREIRLKFSKSQHVEVDWLEAVGYFHGGIGSPKILLIFVCISDLELPGFLDSGNGCRKPHKHLPWGFAIHIVLVCIPFFGIDRRPAPSSWLVKFRATWVVFGHERAMKKRKLE